MPDPHTLPRRLEHARLYVLTDGAGSPEQFRRRTERLIQAGVHVLQLRDKRLGDRELLERGRLLRQLTHRSPTLFIVNDRADLALLCEADGVHVGQQELPVADVRRIVGPQMLVGVSTHTIEQARQAVGEGADYLGCGPTFPSVTKQFTRFAGLEFLQAVHAEIRRPAFAIGGIDHHRLPQVLAAGMRRVAVSSGVLHAEDPAAEVRRLLARLERNDKCVS